MQCNYLKYNYLIFRTPLHKFCRKDTTHVFALYGQMQLFFEKMKKKLDTSA
jgi:hypothetical protein